MSLHKTTVTPETTRDERVKICLAVMRVCRMLFYDGRRTVKVEIDVGEKVTLTLHEEASKPPQTG